MYEENMNPETSGISVNETMKNSLTNSAKWAKYIFLFYSIMSPYSLLLGIITIIMHSGMDQPQTSISLFAYLLFVYPTIKGFQAIKNIKMACLLSSQSALEQGFKALRPCFVWFTVVSIISLVLQVYCFLVESF